MDDGGYTIKELYELLKRLVEEGKGDHVVIMEGDRPVSSVLEDSNVLVLL